MQLVRQEKYLTWQSDPGKYTEAYRNTQKHTEIHKKTQKYTETHKSKQKYTEKHALLCHKQNASGACAVREASDTQKYREIHALSEVKRQDFGRHTLYFIHTTSTPNIVKFVKDFLS